jgi:hypothetical protein
MYNKPLIGDAIIDPVLSPCISQKFSSIDLGCSHPASTATVNSSLDGAASGVDGVEISDGLGGGAICLMSASNAIQKRMVIPAPNPSKMPRRCFMK